MKLSDEASTSNRLLLFIFFVTGQWHCFVDEIAQGGSTLQIIYRKLYCNIILLFMAVAQTVRKAHCLK